MDRQRWLRIGVVAGILFAVNVAGRLVVRIGSIEEAETQDRVAMAAFLAIGLVMAVAGFVWARNRVLGEAVAELVGAIAAGLLLSLLIGPFVGGGTPFGEGFDVFLIQTGLFAAYAGGGALVGVLTLIVLGQDYRSRSLARYAQERLTKPRRT